MCGFFFSFFNNMISKDQKGESSSFNTTKPGRQPKISSAVITSGTTTIYFLEACQYPHLVMEVPHNNLIYLKRKKKEKKLLRYHNFETLLYLVSNKLCKGANIIRHWMSSVTPYCTLQLNNSEKSCASDSIVFKSGWGFFLFICYQRLLGANLDGVAVRLLVSLLEHQHWLNRWTNGRRARGERGRETSTYQRTQIDTQRASEKVERRQT